MFEKGWFFLFAPKCLMYYPMFRASLIPVIALQGLTFPEHQTGGQRQCLLLHSSMRHPKTPQGLKPSKDLEIILFLSISPITSQPLQLNYKIFSCTKRMADIPNLSSNLW